MTQQDGARANGARISRGGRVPASPSVSIIVLVTSQTDRVERCLDSIVAHSIDGPVAEVIVLANGTPASELGRLDSRDDIVLLRSAVNHGFGGGCNWAVRFSAGELLVFLNDDATVTPGWLPALCAAMRSDDRIGVVGSRVLFTDGRLQEAGNVIWSDGSTSHLGRGVHGDAAVHLGLRDVDYVSFCSAMVRRAAWDEVGGFDERYFPAYYEDADLCLAVRTSGWRVACEPTSVVVHDEGGSTSVRFRHFVSQRNRRRFVEKWGSTLAGFDRRPSRVVPRAVLGRVAQPVAAPGMHAAGPPSDASAPRRAEAATPGIGEAEAVAVELGHLAADLALKEEFIARLDAELDEYGSVEAARRGYRALRVRAGRLARRSPRVVSAIEALKARIGEGTSQ